MVKLTALPFKLVFVLFLIAIATLTVVANVEVSLDSFDVKIIETPHFVLRAFFA